MRKWISLVLTVVLLAVVLPVLAEDLDALDAPIRVVWFFNSSGIQIPEDSHLMKKIAEDLNIEFVHAAPQGSDYEERLMVLLASGETPDIITTYSTLTTKLLADDLIIPVDQYLNDEYLPNWRRISRDVDLAIAQSTHSDGHVYTIPSVKNNPLSTAPWIRMDWLEKVGKEVPTTMEELADMLIAFASHGDLNGDGVLTYATMANEYWGLNSPFLAPLAATWDWYWAEDGLPELGVLSPRSKDALAYIKNLMDNGALNRDIVTTTYSQISEKVKAGTVGFLFGYEGTTAETVMQEIYPDAVWQPIAPIKGLYDKGYMNYKDGLSIYEEYAVSSACKDVEAVLRLLDYMCTETSDENGMTYEGTYWNFLGEPGVNYEIINGVVEAGGGDSGDQELAKKYREQNAIDRWVGAPARRFQNQFDTRWMGSNPKNVENQMFLLSQPFGVDIPDDDPLKAITLPSIIEDEVVSNFNNEWSYAKYSEMLCYNAILGKGEIDALYDQFLDAANKAGYQDVRARLAVILGK